MGFGVESERLRIGGMTCVNCQNRIEKQLLATAGVRSAKVSYSAGTADISYDLDTVALSDIQAVIEKLGYQVLTKGARATTNVSRIIGLLIIIAALFFVMQQFGILNLLVPSQLADANMGYAMIFVIGVVTSVHCIAMCGGINLSQCLPRTDGQAAGAGAAGAGVKAVEQGVAASGVKAVEQGAAAGGSTTVSADAAKGSGPAGSGRAGSGRHSRRGPATLRPALLYNLGRVASYTVVGFIVGALGSVITFSAAMQGGLKLVAGMLMVIMGLGMLGLFPWLRKLTPRMPKAIARRVDAGQSRSKSPLIVGLLNGLMPCGPLQAMQIYALSTGSAFAGALSMFLFSAGTVPLMFGLGALSTILSKRHTRKVVTVGAVLVVVLGLSMFTQGWSLSGIGLPELNPQQATAQTSGNGAKIENGVQIVNSSLSGGRYPNITVQAGTPVKWVIDAPQGSINGCNNRMLISEYGIEHSFKQGENVIEFTPTKAGTVRYSCWMGMIRGTINVVEAGADLSAAVNSAAATGGTGTAIGTAGAAGGADALADPEAGGCACCATAQ